MPGTVLINDSQNREHGNVRFTLEVSLSTGKELGAKTDSTSWCYTQKLDHSSLEDTTHTADEHILIGPKCGRVHNRLDAVQRLIALNVI